MALLWPASAPAVGLANCLCWHLTPDLHLLRPETALVWELCNHARHRDLVIIDLLWTWLVAWPFDYIYCQLWLLCISTEKANSCAQSGSRVESAKNKLARTLACSLDDLTIAWDARKTWPHGAAWVPQAASAKTPHPTSSFPSWRVPSCHQQQKIPVPPLRGLWAPLLFDLCIHKDFALYRDARHSMDETHKWPHGRKGAAN